jgi:hypothetical protein
LLTRFSSTLFLLLLADFFFLLSNLISYDIVSIRTTQELVFFFYIQHQLKLSGCHLREKKNICIRDESNKTYTIYTIDNPNPIRK